MHGPEAQLAPLAQALAARAAVTCALTEKTNIWDGGKLRVLEVAVRHPTQFATLARFARQYDSSLRLYNSDLMLAPLYCWEKGVFPLAKVEVDEEPGAGGWGLGAGDRGSNRQCSASGGIASASQEVPPMEVRAIKSRDDEWAVDYELPPLRILRVRLEGPSNVDPQHGRRGALEVEIDGEWRVLDDSEEPVAVGFERLLRAHDPDLIVSEWGDSTLFPALLRQARQQGLTLSLNREAHPVERRRARSYMSYGRILFKESATTLFGRLHVDTQNSFIADQCELEGLWELVRVTKLPVQYCARTTTGTGISYMQMELAYARRRADPRAEGRTRKPQASGRTAQGRPRRIGFPAAPGIFCQRRRTRLHQRVSEHHGALQHFAGNRQLPLLPGSAARAGTRLSHLPATARHHQPRGRAADREAAGIQAPDGWARFSGSAAAGPASRESQPRPNQAAPPSLKWLLVCCFGYTGYKNARFGKIEAHEAINALAREKLLVAKETAEARGYRVLHALVDSLYVQKEDATREDYENLSREIEQRTGLPMALEDGLSLRRLSALETVAGDSRAQPFLLRAGGGRTEGARPGVPPARYAAPGGADAA